MAGGGSADYIASWNGSAWSPLGSGMNNRVMALSIYEGELIAGGNFTTAGGSGANYIASWNGLSWLPLGTGLDWAVIALTVYDNELIVGGWFSSAGGTNANYVASWDGGSWSPLGSGMDSYVFAFTTYNLNLIAGGDFTAADYEVAQYVAIWDGVSWAPLDLSVDDAINALTEYGGELVAGGWFTSTGSVSANRAASWNGTIWSLLGTGLNSGIDALTVYDGKLIAGGFFTTAGGDGANYIAAWDGATWSPLGSGMDTWSVFALTVFDNQLIAGGTFAEAGGVSVNHIAAWDGASWSPLGSGLDGFVWALTVYEDKLIVGGSFSTAGGISAVNIAAWDGLTWSPLGSGTDNEVLALTVSGSKLFVGGAFTSAGGGEANYIASWDGSVWSALGTGMNNSVHALTAYGNQLIAGGRFDIAGGVTANNIAAWDGVSWFPLGSGVNNDVYALSSYNNQLFAGGFFTIAGGKTAAYVATWTKNPENAVTILDDAGVGSLRAAIEYTNSNPGLDTIFFDISGTLTLESALPQITDDSTVILGGTAPGGPHSFVINGNRPVVSSNGLDIQSDFNVVRDLVVQNCFGIGISVLGTNNTIQGNYAGTDATGTVAIPNGFWGIGVGSSGNTIGGYAPEDGNVVCANGTGGMAIESVGHSIIGNRIGVGADGTPLGNTGHGIAFGIDCECTVDSNIIAYNSDQGLLIGVLSTQVTVTRNLIYENGALGIDINDDGVTPNDPGDGDTGPNELINYPEIDSVVSQIDGSYLVYGTSAPKSRIEFFVAHPADSTAVPEDVSGHGEAYFYIDYDTADSTGNFITSIDASTDHFSILTTTCTDTLENTSEFGLNLQLEPAPLNVVAYGPVNITVEDPDNLRYGKDSLGVLTEEIIPADYLEMPNDSVIIYQPKPGTYVTEFVKEAGADPSSRYTAIIKVDGTQSATIVADQQVPEYGTVDTYSYSYDEGGHYINADANDDNQMNISDAVYIINFIFKGGPPPDPWLSADANCNLEVNISDAVLIVNHVFKGGPPPCVYEL
jgi:hypothetical protein